MPVTPQPVPGRPQPPQLAQSAIGQYDVRVTPLQMAMVSAGDRQQRDGDEALPGQDRARLRPRRRSSEASPQQLSQAVTADAAAALTRMMESRREERHRHRPPRSAASASPARPAPRSTPTARRRTPGSPGSRPPTTRRSPSRSSSRTAATPATRPPAAGSPRRSRRPSWRRCWAMSLRDRPGAGRPLPPRPSASPSAAWARSGAAHDDVARPRGRRQGAAPRVRGRRAASVERFRAEARHSGVAVAPEHRAPSTTTARSDGIGVPGDGARSQGEPLSAILARARPAAAGRGRCRSSSRRRRPCRRPTRPASCTATSSRPTSWSTPTGYVKLTDFGIARARNQAPLTQTGEVMGTAQYLSPEQAMGEPAGPLSDVYALGVVGYEMLAGQRPFTGDTLVDTALAHVNEPAPPLPTTSPEPLRTTVMRRWRRTRAATRRARRPFAEAPRACRRSRRPRTWSDRRCGCRRRTRHRAASRPTSGPSGDPADLGHGRPGPPRAPTSPQPTHGLGAARHPPAGMADPGRGRSRRRGRHRGGHRPAAVGARRCRAAAVPAQTAHGDHAAPTPTATTAAATTAAPGADHGGPSPRPRRRPRRTRAGHRQRQGGKRSDRTPRSSADATRSATSLGRGGMAEVHLGHDTRLGRTVAIKMLRSDLARDPSFQTRFRREAQSAASLNHPRDRRRLRHAARTVIEPTGALVPCRTSSWSTSRATPCASRSSDGQPLPARRRSRSPPGVLAALAYSHRPGIVHRDIKPANVMLDADRRDQGDGLRHRPRPRRHRRRR